MKKRTIAWAAGILAGALLAGPPAQAASLQPDGRGTLSPIPYTVKILTGDHRAREDFSQQANPAVFTEALTRAAYNAARQSILDRDTILAGNQDGINPYYAYAHTTAAEETQRQVNQALGRIGSYCRYLPAVEPYLQGYWNYPDYFIVAPQIPESSAAAQGYTDAIIAKASTLTAAADKVRLLNDYLCSRMSYQRRQSPGFSRIFNPAEPIACGKCTAFASAFQYLCERAGIPCVRVIGENHVWNAVYVDGKWRYVDVSLNTQVPNRAMLLLGEHSRKQDEHPELTRFAMELLVPGSTK